MAATTKKPKKKSIPQIILDGDFSSLAEMYEADKAEIFTMGIYRPVEQCRALLEEAYREYRDNAKNPDKLPETFREILDLEGQAQKKDATKGKFPLHLFPTVAREANRIIRETMKAEKALDYIDRGAEGAAPVFLHNLSFEPKDEQADPSIEESLYMTMRNTELFSEPEAAFRELLKKAESEEVKKAMLKFQSDLSMAAFRAICRDVAAELGVDEKQLIEGRRRTEAQRKRIIQEMRATIKRNADAVANSKYQRMIRFLFARSRTGHQREKSRNLDRATERKILQFAVSYFFATTPGSDFRAQEALTEQEALEALDIFSRLLDRAEHRKEGESVSSVLAKFVEEQKPHKEERRQIAQEISDQAEECDQWIKILQGNATNDFISTGNKQLKKDVFAGIATAKTNSTEMTFTNPSSINLSTPCKKVFEVLTMKLTKNLPSRKEADANKIAAARKVDFTVQEYMNICGTKNKTQAYQQLNDALNTIYNVSMKFSSPLYKTVKYKGKDGKTKTKTQKEERVIKTRILEAMEHDAETPPKVENGKISVYFAFGLAEYLAKSYIMPFHKELMKIDGKHNPHSYYLGRRLCQHHNMNKGDANENRISVERLRSCCPDLPSYEEIRENSKHVRQRIIDPVERDLNLLQDKGILNDWHYCRTNGEVIPDDEISNANYQEWVKFLIEFDLADYPADEEE